MDVEFDWKPSSEEVYTFFLNEHTIRWDSNGSTTDFAQGTLYSFCSDISLFNSLLHEVRLLPGSREITFEVSILNHVLSVYLAILYLSYGGPLVLSLSSAYESQSFA